MSNTVIISGPWKAIRCKNSRKWSIRHHRYDDFSIATVQAEDNARLIASAPCLLKAAKDVIEDLKLFISRQGPGPDRRLDTLMDAINKAEGETG